jgi:hypothetical protein
MLSTKTNKPEWLLSKLDYTLNDENGSELIFKKNKHYFVLSIILDPALVPHYEIVYDYDDAGSPMIMFVELDSRNKYFYSISEIRKMKLNQICNS